jgi:hypothetical protein
MTAKSKKIKTKPTLATFSVGQISVGIKIHQPLKVVFTLEGI